MKLIDKDALVAEIERWIELLTNEKNQEGISLIDKLSLGGRIAELQEVKTFINNLEVKEVDLEKFLKEEIEDEWFDSDYGHIQRSNGTTHMTLDDVREIAKHFFELGMQQSKNYNNNEE